MIHVYITYVRALELSSADSPTFFSPPHAGDFIATWWLCCCTSVMVKPRPTACLTAQPDRY